MKINIDHLIVEVTHQCNYRCQFCYNHWKADGTEVDETPSYESLKKTLLQLFKQVNVRHIAFTGGEPMLQSRLPELMLLARLHKCKVTLLTNGSLINPISADDIKTLGVHGIQIPLLSHRAIVHDELTMTKGSWEKSMEAIKMLRKAGLPVSAILVVTAKNLNDIEPTFALAKSLGCDRILLNRFNIGGLGLIYCDELRLNQAQIKQLFTSANNAAAMHGLKVSSGVCTPICIADPGEFKNIRFSFCNTDLTTRPLTIDFNGNVRFCNHSPENIGNIFSKTFEQIIKNKSTRAIFSEIPSMCKECSRFSLCNAGCRAAAQQTGKGFNHPDPVLIHH